MASTSSVKAKIQGLIDRSNEVTERADTDLTSAVGALIELGESGGGLEGFFAVRFYNDDRATLLYTVYVPSGSSAIYAGETPTSIEDETAVFMGFEPLAMNVTEDLDCYAVYEPLPTTLEGASWEMISLISEEGTAQNYFAVGDTKMIHIEGTVGTIDVNADYGVYIIAFDHNKAQEGKGIHFGTFKTNVGKDIAIIDAEHQGSEYTNGTKYFNMNHWNSTSIGGWAGCDMRYDILGSTDIPPRNYGTSIIEDRVGYDATDSCATNPVPNTLMAAFPSDLRAVMKPMTKYTDNNGNQSKIAENVTATIDYLPLMATFEVGGATENPNPYERNNQQQYAYFTAGNSARKYKHSSLNNTCMWSLRTPYKGGATHFDCVSHIGTLNIEAAGTSHGLAPIFKV